VANITLPTADSSGFIPQYWANRALDVLRRQIVLAQVVAKDVDFGEAGWEGKTITVPYPGTFTAVAKTAGNPVTPQVPVGGQSVPLTLTQHQVVPFLVEDFAAAQASESLMDRYIQPAVVALAEKFESDLFMAALQCNGAEIGTPLTDLTAAMSRSAMQQLSARRAPITDRALVVSTKDQAALLGDSSLANYFAFAQQGAVANGFFGRLYGFDVYWTQMAPLGYFVTLAANGTFTFNSQTTATLTSSTLTAAAFQAALEGLSSVGTGLVKVASVDAPAAGSHFSVTFDPSIDTTGTLTASASTVSAKGQKNVAIHKNAVMFAVRPFAPIDAAAGVQTATANDPESGLSLRISSQYDVNNIGMRCNLDLLYGVVPLRTNQGVIIDT
jgi:hypothetical protein